MARHTLWIPALLILSILVACTGKLIPTATPTLHPTPTITLPPATVRIEEETLLDSNANIGDTDVSVGRFKVVNSSTTDILLKHALAIRKGSTDSTHTKNIELYDASTGASVDVVPQWIKGGAPWFGFSVEVKRGETRIFEIRLDIIGGPGHNVAAELHDSIGLETADGRKVEVIWDKTAHQNYQTIQSGSLTISFPTTLFPNQEGFWITPGETQQIGAVSFCVRGGPVQINPLPLSFNLTNMQASDLRDVKFMEHLSGTIWAGPEDIVPVPDIQVNGFNVNAKAVFSDTFLVKVGCTDLLITADVTDTISPAAMVSVAIADPDGDIGVKGVVSKDTITPYPFNTAVVVGNAKIKP